MDLGSVLNIGKKITILFAQTFSTSSSLLRSSIRILRSGETSSPIIPPKQMVSSASLLVIRPGRPQATPLSMVAGENFRKAVSCRCASPATSSERETATSKKEPRRRQKELIPYE